MLGWLAALVAASSTCLGIVARHGRHKTKNCLSRAKTPKGTGRESSNPREQGITSHHVAIVKLGSFYASAEEGRDNEVQSPSKSPKLCTARPDLPPTRKELDLLIIDVYPSCIFAYINFALALQCRDTRGPSCACPCCHYYHRHDCCLSRNATELESLPDETLTVRPSLAVYRATRGTTELQVRLLRYPCGCL